MNESRKTSPAGRPGSHCLFVAVLILLSGLGSARAQVRPRQPVVHGLSLLQPPPPLASPIAEPRLIAMGQTTTVRFTSRSSTRWAPSRPTLMVLDSKRNPVTPLGVMHDDGQNGDRAPNDSVYTLEVPMTPTSLDTILVRVIVFGGDDVGPQPSSPIGAVFVKSSASVPPPPVTMTESPSVGLRVQVPPGWVVNQRVLAAHGPISMTTGGREHGGVADGAEIDITRVPVPPNGVAAYAENELVDADIYRKDTPAVSGVSSYRVRYRDRFDGNYETENVVVYLTRGKHLYKFYLTYRRGDPRARQNEMAFSRIVRGITFLGKD
jgi:hypothetical protein